MPKQLQQDREQIPPILLISLNKYGQLEAKTRLALTAVEVAELLTLSPQKVRWMMLRGDLPSIHFGGRRVVSLEALEYYVREHEIEEQQNRLEGLKRYYGSFGFGEPHREIQQAQERVNAMQQRQGSVPKEQNTPRISIEAALYHITITESGRLNVRHTDCLVWRRPHNCLVLVVRRYGYWLNKATFLSFTYRSVYLFVLSPFLNGYV